MAAANDEVFRGIEDDKETQPAKPAGNLWTNAYGAGPRVGQVNVWMLRYRQTFDDTYRRAILREAELYRTQEVNWSQPVWPGTLGAAVWLMLNAHELTGEDKYLAAADRFARKGVEMFLDNDPLPKASHAHGHYEAVTNGDTLMMALLKLWLVQNRPESKIGMTFTDR